MDAKRFVVVALLVVFIIAFFEYLINEFGLAPFYSLTASLWRSPEELGDLWLIRWLSYLIFAPVFVFIYKFGYEKQKNGLCQGMRYGFLIALLVCAPMAINGYASMPIPAVLSLGWFVGGLVEMMAAGIVVGLMWKE